MNRLIQGSSSIRHLLVPVAAVLALLAAMVAGTKFVPADDAWALSMAGFSAKEYAEEAWPHLVESIMADAIDLPPLAAAVDADAEAAGAEHGIDMGAGRFVYQVRATGDVVAVDGDFVQLAVPGEDGDLDVRIPLGAALTGSPVRDATGDIRFGDFTDQNEYQSVANELKFKVQSEVLAPVDPPSLEGETVTVTGAWVTGGPAETYLIQPVAIEVDS